ncbi:MAG: exodeoxyribonuclease V subunit alpha [Leptospirales bacterium]|nr:exodeoxyribonuclease V subunit alpha [Leptospirales bacterium]
MNFSIDDIKNTGCFDDIDIHLADFLSNMSGEGSSSFYLLCLFLSNRLSNGDLCLFLDEIAEKPVSYFFDDNDNENDLSKKIIFPSLDELTDLLNKNRVVGVEGDYLPLVLDSKKRLYFHKYYSFENLLSEHIKALANARTLPANVSEIGATFSLLFPQSSDVDWQSVAAYSALSGGITVVSGGPGTGKTSTVVKILSLIVESKIKRSEGVSISLSAPTGKAAARLREAVNTIIADLPISAETKKLIPTETFTIHRLLGPIINSHKFRHNKENPLSYDVVVVDECSMVDIALMLRLVQALKPGAQLILLGDKYQLSSVEGGAVFGDICGRAEGISEGIYSKDFINHGKKFFNINIPAVSSGAGINKMNDALIVLDKNYRFGSRSGIGILAELIKRGDASRVLEILEDENYPDIKFIDAPSLKDLGDIYRETIQVHIKDQDASTTDKIFSLINNLTILTATRRGIFSADGMNRMAEEILYRLGIIDPIGKFYHGRPIMALRNDYALSLFNGDMGVTSDMNNVLFKDAEGNFRTIHTSRLPEHETAYAMTVHKSQGSEFDNVLIVLPDKWNRVMTRELLYTAVTRAKEKVIIAAHRDIIKETVLTPTKRMSGLKDKIWSYD